MYKDIVEFSLIFAFALLLIFIILIFIFLSLIKKVNIKAFHNFQEYNSGPFSH